MDRYMRVHSVTFDGISLPLPISVHLSRQAGIDATGGDDDTFVTSVQLDRPVISAKVRIRGTAAAEGLILGQQGALSFIISPSRSGSAQRTITLAGAVLAAIELVYEQASAAEAVLTFVAEAGSGNQDPFSAEESE